MAKISPSTNEKLVSIKVFGGLHESPDGDNKLKNGEAVKCQNFKVTNNGNLMKRYGTTLKWTLGDEPVKGMWHGWCSYHELFIAACDGQLWMLQDNNIKKYPTSLGLLDTTNDVFMFGFDEKVFVMNGVIYGCVWFDYVPTSAIATGTPIIADPEGESTLADVVVDVDKFGAEVGDGGVFTYYYAGKDEDNHDKWAERLVIQADFDKLGITYDGQPVEGDKITVAYTPSAEGSWHFENLADPLTATTVYVPLVAVAIPPNGGGSLLEEVNKLTPKRRVWISTIDDGTLFKLPEKDIKSVDAVIDLTTHEATTEAYNVDLEDGEVTFQNQPVKRSANSYEIQYTVKVHYADTIARMRYAELYAGTQDSRVFIYGDGSNRAFYSAIDYLGHPRGDYFPDLYEVTVGDTNTPITGMIRHYTKLLVFKPTETFNIDYGVVTLADGLMTPSFYTTPVNKNAGNQAVGQVQLVLNAPRTLCQGNLYEWRNGSAYSANLSIDERQAKRISDRIYDTLQKMDFSKVHCYDDDLNTEYYIIDDDGNALVHNYFVDAWYYYTGVDARIAMAVDGDLYIGTKSGKVMLLDENAMSDDGEPIDCYWESGSMDFGASNMRKYSAQMWVAIKSEDKNAVNVTVKTDRSESNTEAEVEPDHEFEIPKMSRLKVKVKKFVYYKLIFKSCEANKKVTVVDTVIKVRYTSQAK